MAKILVVDDEPDLETLIKQKFRQKIRENHYEFIFSLNGVDALNKLQQHPEIEIMLCDINMPVMDGLTLLGKLKESNSLVKTVMVSAYGDMDNIRTAMNRGAYDFITKPVNFEDLELTMQKTLDHVKMVKRTLQAIKENNILKMYVDETVLNFMGSREFESAIMANETLRGTVAFIDICGFTSISERENADTVVGLLNSYFDIIVKEIIAQGGYVDKFMGDAVMAVFRGDYHLDRGIDACLNVRKKLKGHLVAGADKSFAPQVAIGIGSGEMVSGNIGSASLKRLDYTVIGDVVNTAQRLQTVAGPGQIIINEQAFELINTSFQCTRIGEVNLKNKSNPVVVYNVIE